MHANNDIDKKAIKAANPSAVRRTDRRPKGIHPKKRRSICLSPQLDRLVENETLRRNYPSVSALIEDLVAKDIVPKSDAPEDADLLGEIRQLGLRLHRFERETAERDVITVEMLAGLVRAYFATAEQPAPEDRPARIADAKAQFERFLNAVGRKIESGETTLNQLPDVHFAPEPAGEERAGRSPAATSPLAWAHSRPSV